MDTDAVVVIGTAWTIIIAWHVTIYLIKKAAGNHPSGQPQTTDPMADEAPNLTTKDKS